MDKAKSGGSSCFVAGIDGKKGFLYNEDAAGNSGRDRENAYAGLSEPAGYERQVMNMSAYEIAMICISSMGLLLALIKLINDLRK